MKILFAVFLFFLSTSLAHADMITDLKSRRPFDLKTFCFDIEEAKKVGLMNNLEPVFIGKNPQGVVVLLKSKTSSLWVVLRKDYSTEGVCYVGAGTEEAK